MTQRLRLLLLGACLLAITGCTGGSATGGIGTTSSGGWTTVKTGTINGTLNNLFAVGGTGPTDVWAAGDGQAIEHWDGSSWTSLIIDWRIRGSDGPFRSLWGSGREDVWAVGSGMVLHWNGSAWSNASSSTPQFPQIAIDHVWGSGPNDVWFVGQGGAVHWNGSAWSTLSIEPPAGLAYAGLTYVWGSGSSDVWALGRDLVGPIVYHWNGTKWSNQPLVPSVLPPAATGTYGADLVAIWGTGPNDVWAVGSQSGGGYQVDPTGVIVHWNGTTWSNVAIGTTSALSGIWGSGSNDVWAVGQKGTILHWNGSSWTVSASGVTRPLDAVWGSGPGDVWVVGGPHDGNVVSDGEQGTVLHHGP